MPGGLAGLMALLGGGVVAAVHELEEGVWAGTAVTLGVSQSKALRVGAVLQIVTEGAAGVLDGTAFMVVT